MKTPCHIRFVVALALVPALAFAAKDEKARKRPANDPAPGAGEVLKSYDKNGNKQIDADELAAMQKAFAEMRKLDKNGNGEIESAEVEPPKAATTDRKDRAMAGIQKVDKNGNGKIDADEVEPLQKMLAGGKIMQKLDQNGNGKLESNELERLNQRISQSGFERDRPGNKPTPPPSTSKPPTEPDKAAKPDAKPEEKKKEESKDLAKDPFLPTPETKPPGNFGDKP